MQGFPQDSSWVHPELMQNSFTTRVSECVPNACRMKAFVRTHSQLIQASLKTQGELIQNEFTTHLWLRWNFFSIGVELLKRVYALKKLLLNPYRTHSAFIQNPFARINWTLSVLSCTYARATQNWHRTQYPRHDVLSLRFRSTRTRRTNWYR